MTPQSWACRQLLFSIALALAFVPVCKAGEPQEAGSQPSPQLNPSGAPQTIAKPPQVTYQDGQLTVIAENSSLSEVMKALRAALGADIDLPTTVADQHIWVRFGPGPARQVLRELLDGTEFNYVIQASENDADGIRSVVLTPRSKSTGPDTTGLMERAANRRMPRGASDAANAVDSENPSPEPVASASPSQAAPPASAADQSAAANQSTASASLQNNNASDSDSDASKNSGRMDQMIQQLQSMYQQRRQLQVQQNQKPTGQN